MRPGSRLRPSRRLAKRRARSQQGRQSPVAPSRKTTTNRTEVWFDALWFVVTIAFATWLGVSTARASQVAQPASDTVPCAVLESFGGRVELLDPARTRLLDSSHGSGIPCGGWVSVGAGWALVRHRDGFRIHLGQETFTQLPDPTAESAQAGDHVVLVKGDVYASAGGGTGELRIVTSNARARVTQGAGLVAYSPENEETQLTAFGRPATLENRFEITRRMTVKSGESSSLHFKALRVVPSTPRVVAIAALRSKLVAMHVGETEQQEATSAARARQERKFAAALPKGRKAADASGEPVDPNRVPASQGEDPQAYVRHSASEEDAQLRAQWVRKIVGGSEAGERILFPDKFYGRTQEVKVEVIDPLEKTRVIRTREEAAEKKRLVEELSNLHPE